MKKRLICGIGVNDADYVVKKEETVGYVDGKRKKKLVWRCPYYSTWAHLIHRCYSNKFHEKNPTYKGCTVDNEWLTFSNFRSWMVLQDWQDNQLDKDLLIKDNKVYSPKTCVFVSPTINLFLTERAAKRGKLLIGVCWIKRNQKFMAQVNNPFTKKNEYLGLYTSELEAHKVWLKRKLELAHELAAIQTDPRVAKALIERYTNYIP